jgi:O-antigen/teichoic acid export membrane protein
VEVAALINRQAARMIKFSGSRRARTMFDQAIVSGSNFATGIILVRGLGLVDFGIFTVAYSMLLLANSIQLSFISSPMLTLGSLCSTVEERRRFVRGIFGAQVVFGLIAAIVSLAAAIAFIVLSRGVATVGAVLAFVMALVAYLMQDWLRRYYFTIDRAATAVWNDAISYLVQVLVLCVLSQLHGLTVESAFWAIAMTSGSAFALGVFMERLRFDLPEARKAWRQCRSISVNLGISNQLQWLVYQGAMLVGAGVVGPQAAGAVRATQNAIGPVNVAFQAMENIVPIRAAEEMRRGGVRSVASFLLRFGLIGFSALLFVFLAVSLFSGRFLTFFYGGQLQLYAGVLNLQMLYFLLAWPVRQFIFLFRTIGSTTPILISSIVAAAISLACVYPMVHSFGALGIMIAAVGGQIGNLLYLMVAWLRVRTMEDVPVLKTIDG